MTTQITSRSASRSASRLSIVSAAFVIARRDFTAILFSKAFLFFLLGPILLIAISAGAGVLGAKAAEGSAPPALAIALGEQEGQAFARTHEQLAELTRLPDIAVEPSYARTDPAEILASTDRNVAAVLTGSLADPVLIGPTDRIEAWQGEVALIAANVDGNTGAYPAVALQPTQTSVASQRSDKAAIATGSLTLLFLLTMLLAGMVLSNLVEEKGNKIIEILAAAIPMDAVFLGKLFAMLGISLVGIAVWGSLAGIVLALGAQALGAVPEPAVGWGIFVPLFLLYFAMAYLLIGSIFLAVGSLAPTVRDVQTISMPATFLQLAVFFLATFAMSDTGSPVELFAVMFPLSSPFAMLARAAQEPVLWWHLAALAWQLLWVVLFVRTGANLFRRKVLQSGPRKPGKRKRRRKGEVEAA